MDKHALLKLSQNIIIPPFTEAIVRVRVPSYFIKKPCIMETHEPMKSKKILTVPALIEPQGKSSICRICNFGHTERQLQIGTPIAKLVAVDTTDPEVCMLLSMNQQTPPPQQTADTASCRSSTANHHERLAALTAIGLKLENDNPTPAQLHELTALLYEYREIFCSQIDDLPLTNLPAYKIKIKPDTKPIRLRRYPLPPIQERILEEYTSKLLKANVVEECESPWNSPAIIIKKHKSTSNVGFVDTHDNKFDLSNYRLVVDFRRVNEIILNDFQSLTDVQTIFTQVAETHPKFFSSFDVSNSFYQVNLDPASRDMTAYSTKTRHVRFCRAGQGLRSSPSAWLQQIHGVFRRELQSNLANYMDDGLTRHSNSSDHLAI